MTDYIDNEGTEENSMPSEASQAPSLIEKFVIRLPKGLRNTIKHLSEQNRRSMNSELILVLEKHIQQSLLSQTASMDDFTDGRPVGELSESELSRKLEDLPKEKKAALLELLG